MYTNYISALLLIYSQIYIWADSQLSGATKKRGNGADLKMYKLSGLSEVLCLISMDSCRLVIHYNTCAS